MDVKREGRGRGGDSGWSRHRPIRAGGEGRERESVDVGRATPPLPSRRWPQRLLQAAEVFSPYGARARSLSLLWRHEPAGGPARGEEVQPGSRTGALFPALGCEGGEKGGRCVEGGRLSRLGASPGPRGIPPLSEPSRGRPERAGDPSSGVPCGVRAVKQGRGCPAVLELLGKRQSRSMPSTSRWQPHAVTRCSSEGGKLLKGCLTLRGGHWESRQHASAFYAIF